MAVLAKIRALSNETRLEIVKLVRDREMEAGTVAVARRPTAANPNGENLGTLSMADLAQLMAKEIHARN